MTGEERVGFLGFRRYPDFFKLWAGETVSLFGSQITALALPLTAVLTLQATPAQLGALNAARYAPFLLVTLFAGVWVDRGRRRPVLIGANLGRMVLLLLIPLPAVSEL
jgi:MFS family permease